MTYHINDCVPKLFTYVKLFIFIISAHPKRSSIEAGYGGYQAARGQENRGGER